MLLSFFWVISINFRKIPTFYLQKKNFKCWSVFRANCKSVFEHWSNHQYNATFVKVVSAYFKSKFHITLTNWTWISITRLSFTCNSDTSYSSTRWSRICTSSWMGLSSITTSSGAFGPCSPLSPASIWNCNWWIFTQFLQDLETSLFQW